MPTLATAVQDAVCGRLAYFGLQGIPVHGLRRGKTYSEVAAALDAVGLAVHVLPVLSRGINGNIPGPWVDGGQLVVRVVEDPLLNQTDITRWDIMEQAITTLEGWDPAITNCHPLQIGTDVSESIVGMGLNEPDRFLLQLEVSVTVRGPIMATALASTLGTTPLEALDTPVLKRGHVVLNPSDLTGSVVFTSSYAEVPVVVLASVVVPSGGAARTVTVSEITQYGFTWTLNSAVPSSPAGYVLQWLAQL